MADKKKLAQMMQKRNAPREVVRPSNLYRDEKDAGKEANQQASKLLCEQTSKPAN